MRNPGVALLIAALPAGSALAAENIPSSVLIRNGHFTDLRGMTLYSADSDRVPNASSCYDNCSHNWPTFAPAEADRDIGDWKIIIREDGTTQWAYKGKPVYRFILDRQPGDARGDGTGKVWHVVHP